MRGRKRGEEKLFFFISAHTHTHTQVSKIFDPFMFLSLPLPIKKTRTLIVTLVRTDPAAELYRVRDNLEHQEKVIHVLQI